MKTAFALVAFAALMFTANMLVAVPAHALVCTTIGNTTICS